MWLYPTYSHYEVPRKWRSKLETWANIKARVTNCWLSKNFQLPKLCEQLHKTKQQLPRSMVFKEQIVKLLPKVDFFFFFLSFWVVTSSSWTEIRYFLFPLSHSAGECVFPTSNSCDLSTYSVMKKTQHLPSARHIKTPSWIESGHLLNLC